MNVTVDKAHMLTRIFILIYLDNTTLPPIIEANNFL